MIVIIMAGGLGKRMKSTLPKVLHHVKNKPMLVHVIEQSLELNPFKICVVVGKYQSVIKSTLQMFNVLDKVEFIQQKEALGTGHAIQCCRPTLLDCAASLQVLILSGDVPLIKSETLREMVYQFRGAKVLTSEVDNPHGYGRIIEKNGQLIKIIEEKDCNEEERLVKKTNSGIYAFQNEYLCKYLPYLKNNNAQKEFYLTDIIEILQTTEQITIDTYNLPKERQIELIGVNTKEQLEELNKSLGF